MAYWKFILFYFILAAGASPGRYCAPNPQYECNSFFKKDHWNSKYVSKFGLVGLGYFLLLINVIDIKLLFQRKEWANVLCINQHAVSRIYKYAFFSVSLTSLSFCYVFSPEKITHWNYLELSDSWIFPNLSIPEQLGWNRCLSVRDRNRQVN